MKIFLLSTLFFFLTSPAFALKIVYLTTGTTWTVPVDWNNSNNTIECIGGGAAGREGNDTPGIGAGGGGGAYSKSVNVTLSGNISYVVGAGGSSDAADGGDTVFNGTTLGNVSATAGCAAERGHGSPPNGSQVGGAGGAAANGTAVGPGAVKYNGGSAICNNTGNWANSLGPVGAGGGAAGPLGAGGSVTWVVISGCCGGGNGGGGNGGGNSGGNTTASLGANGGNNQAGLGGGAGGSSSNTVGAAGTYGGGGGGGGRFAAGGNGGNGTEWNPLYGSGSGGGANGQGNGSGTSNPPGNGGLYGGGGAGGGDGEYAAWGSGAAGIIVITYASTNNYNSVIHSSSTIQGNSTVN